MSVLIVTAAERAALEAEFAKMQAAGTLPGGVMLGIPVESEDGRFIYCDARWDAKETKADAKPVIEKRLAVLVADTKVGVTTATRVAVKVPVDFVLKDDVKPVELKPVDVKPVARTVTK